MGGLFSVYRHPTDSRWQGPQRWGPMMMLLVTFFFILSWILFISDQIYSRILWDRFVAWHNATGQPFYKYAGFEAPVKWYSVSQYYSDDAVGQFFLRAGLAIIPETIHQPLHHYLLHKNRMHPIAALTLSIIFLGLWMSSAWMNFIFPFSDTDSEGCNCDPWTSLIYAEFTFQHVIVILYLVYMGFAAHAVRLYNRRKMDNGAYGKGVAKGMELANLERDAMKSGTEDYERGILKGLEMAHEGIRVEHVEDKKGDGNDLPSYEA